MITCKGFCSNIKEKLESKTYDGGAKRCTCCGIFLFSQKSRCPCCNNRLRTKPRGGKKSLNASQLNLKYKIIWS
ncbi:MAG: hypothetical protein EPO63_06590 [Candidatus Nitrosotenuis sp.]|nr:MAG: hypothetical protein EPO63_06590 [Candidatus Nitrosotenuis sp.]